jgi:hypothetical protein
MSVKFPLATASWGQEDCSDREGGRQQVEQAEVL